MPLPLRSSLLLFLLTALAPLSAATLRTADGLALDLGNDGQVLSVSLEGRALPGAPGGGFYLREPEGQRHDLRCPVVPDAGRLIQKQRFDDLQLTAETTCTPGGDALRFSIQLTNHTDADRAVEVGFELPFDAAGWTWWDDPRVSRKISEPTVYRNARGKPGETGGQVYPFSAVSRGTAGISMALPPDEPSAHVIEVDGARKCLAIRFMARLAAQVDARPARCSFMLYAHDGVWGMRSALQRYARPYPEIFEKRVPYEGYLGTDLQESTGLLRGPKIFYGLQSPGDFGRALRAVDVTALTPEALQEWARREPRREPYHWCLPLPAGRGSTELAAAAALAQQHQLLLARPIGVSPPDPANTWRFFDIGLLPRGAEDSSLLFARALAGPRLLRFSTGDVTGEAALREALHRGMLYAIYPGLQPDADKHRELYLQVVPVIERLSAAGWEPVTLAHAPAADLHLERYGRLSDNNLCLALRNVGAQALATRVVLDPALGLPGKPGEVMAVDLLSGRELAAGLAGERLAVPVALQPGESTAWLLTPRSRWLQRTLLDAAETLEQAVPLTAEKIMVQPSRPGQLLAGDTPPGHHASTILCDGWKTEQGLVWPAGETLTIMLDLNSPHRLRWLRVHYGTGGEALPVAAQVEALDRQGQWVKLGELPPPQDAAWPESTFESDPAGESQRLRLVYPELKQPLWLKEIEVSGDDGALTRQSERFRAMAANTSFDDFGLIGQLAIMLRVRRMLGHDSVLQERALTHLAAFCSAASGIHVRLEVPPDAPRTGPLQAFLVVENRGSRTLREGNVKLKLPPGWSAAPGKFQVGLPPRESVRLPLTLTRPADGGRLTLLITGTVDETPLFMSQQE